jgi:hypothetical protein
LAYFRRYPNPFARHVLSVDVLSRHLDSYGRLHTTRLILKRGILPKWAARWLPVKGEGMDAWVLETSIIDPPGWGETQSQGPAVDPTVDMNAAPIPTPTSSHNHSSATPGTTAGAEVQPGPDEPPPKLTIFGKASQAVQRGWTGILTEEQLGESSRSALERLRAGIIWPEDEHEQLPDEYWTLPRLRLRQWNLNHRKLMYVIEGGELRAGLNGCVVFLSSFIPTYLLVEMKTSSLGRHR